MNALTAPVMPLQDMQTLASAIAKSGLFGIRTPEQALVLMAIAQAEGKHPVEAARDYDIINNRPAKKAEAMMRDFIQAGGKVKWHSLTDDLADATFTHPQTGEVRISWDKKRAQTAFGTKDMYTKFPRQMLRSRVVSEGVRTLWPLATSGMYEPGETANIQEHDGPTIDAEPEQPDARDAINAEVPVRAAAADMQRPPSRSEGATQGYSDDKWRVWLDRTRAAMDLLRSRQEVVEVGERDSVGNAMATGPEWLRRDLSALLAEHYARFPEAPEDELPEIVGEEKLAAG